MRDKFNILVVEDDAAAGKVICFELKARGEVLGADDLPVFILSRESPGSDSSGVNIDSSPALHSLPDRLAAIEKDILEKTLKRHNYHQTNAARELGISEARLRYKIRTLGIPRMKKNGENR